jgi:hypothetical protein
MINSAVSICNQALGKIGISQFIANLETEQSNEARVCRVYYEAARDRVLQAMPWGFARRVAELQDIGTPPAGWLYRYRYPNDCLFARKVIETGATEDSPGQPFTVSEDEANGGLAICSNTYPASLIYTARITNTALFSALFTDALAWALAVDLSAPLSAQPSMAQSASQAYVATLAQAAARHLNEDQPQDTYVSELMAVRQ